ncbi:hypothetical protein [Brevibacterium litoralis]|uniref:hypothetical protein n=1 Tax=Brevibacterium litoralis TaxID=3138935 RepID=UPI0032EAE4B3
MRYIFSALLLVAGLVVGGLGIAQQTVWAPSERISASAQVDGDAPLLVIDPGVLNLYDTPAELTVTGEGEMEMARATKEFVDAWVAESEVTTVTGLASEGVLATTTAGEGGARPLSTGDTWDALHTGDGEITLDWDEEPERTTFLIATDGEAPAADSVTITWPNNTDTPWAMPLMIGGGVLVLAGLVLLGTGIVRTRKIRAREAERVKRRKKLAETGMAMIAVPALALAGCGPQEELPTPQPAAPPTTAPASITDAQVEELLADTASDVQKADEELDPKHMVDRAAGPFVDQRRAAYSAKKGWDDAPIPPAIADEEILVNWTNQTDEWPRQTAVIAQDQELEQTQYLLWEQPTPRAYYKLQVQTVLLPGTELPTIPDPRLGAPPVALDSEDLVMKPQDVMKNYADLLEERSDSDFRAAFADDRYRVKRATDENDLVDALSEGNASAEFEYTAPEDQEVFAQATEDGAAIVSGVIEWTETMKPEVGEGGTGELTLGTPQKEMSGTETTSDEVTTTHVMEMTFLVPSKDAPEEEQKVQLIGTADTVSSVELE